MRDVSSLGYSISDVEGLLGDPRYIRPGSHRIDSVGYVEEVFAEEATLLSRNVLYRDGAANGATGTPGVRETTGRRFPRLRHTMRR